MFAKPLAKSNTWRA